MSQQPLRYITVHGGWNSNGAPIACPECGNTRRLTFSVFEISDTYSMATCPNNHGWREYRVDGEAVEDAQRITDGLPPIHDIGIYCN